MLAGNIVKNYAEDLAAALIKLLLDLAGFGIGYNAGVITIIVPSQAGAITAASITEPSGGESIIT